MQTAEDFLPKSRDIDSLRKASKGCRGCPLYQNATQAVFGEGKANASLFLIGEQPGDQEDKQGRPFIGPAGNILRTAIDQAGLIEDNIYITNAVKHFKWIAAGARRLHQKPNSRERTACLPWLEAELEAVRPKAIVCLGATAAQSVFDNDFRVTRHKNEILQTRFGLPAIATMHPAAILRMRDHASREEARMQLAADLKHIQEALTIRTT